MNIVVCVDDCGGMMFNKRRQSQDRVVRQHIFQEAEGHTLWMNEYSRRQFTEDVQISICVDENMLDKAGEEEWCFIENMGVAAYKEQIHKIVIFKWNKKYPADFYFDLPPGENGLKLKHFEEFKGFSHEKITKEVYEK